ncbi:MAG: NYN domain-containing protein [Candidatus Lokiarchaeota archaeon]|nr:NYN domain-containing protein [Candidatus Lokiarchaeota archaeon]
MLKRLIIFIDHANFFHNLEKHHIRINYAKFKEFLSNKFHLVGAFIYMGFPPELYPKKRRFIKYLDAQGFVIQSKEIKVSPNGKKAQKGVDIYIYRDIVELAEEDSYDKAILVSGDSDFVDIIKRLQELKKDYEIWGFRESISNQLIRIAGDFKVHYIEDILPEIKI